MSENSEKPTSSTFERLALSPFSQFLGPIDLRWDPHPVFEATVREDCVNSMGRAHGGFIASLIDIAAGQGVKRILDDGRSLVTATTNIEYLGAARVGDVLHLSVLVERDTKSLVFTRCRVAVETKTVALASVLFSARPQ